MSVTSLMVPPRCPACDLQLQPAEGGRACRRCGRAFEIGLIGLGEGGVYRDGGMLDLVPLHTAPPDEESLDIVRDDHIFHVKMMGSAFPAEVLFFLFFQMVGTIFLALLDDRPIVRLILLLFTAATTLAGVEICMRERRSKQELLLDENRLHWRSFDVDGCRAGELAFPYSELRAVHDLDGRVRVMLHDGSAMSIARGMPRGVRRFLAQRIAERLPLPDEVPAGAEPILR